MFTTKRITSLLGATLSLAIVLATGVCTNASAATVTWTAKTDDSDTVWSNTAYWSTGEVPGPDDDVVITSDNGATYATPGLDVDVNVNSISSSDGSSVRFAPESDVAKNNTDITVSIGSFAKSINFDGNTYIDGVSHLTIKPTGEEVTFTNFSLGYLGTLDLNGKTVNLNGFVVSQVFKDNSAKITGNGTLNLNAQPDDQDRVYAIRSRGNDYTGVTNINGVDVGVYFIDAFGSSEVNLNNASVSWELAGVTKGIFQADFTELDGLKIANKININNSDGPSVTMSFEGEDEVTLENHPTISIPNMTFNSNASFITDGIAINATGSNANGHCVELDNVTGASDSTDHTPIGGDSDWFIGFPAVCEVFGGANSDMAAGGNYPGAPAAGQALRNPIVIVSLGVMVAIVVAVLVRHAGRVSSR